MRIVVIAALLVSLALVLGAPTTSSGSSGCDAGSCGVPSCWDQVIRLRPDMTRNVPAPCSGVASAELLTPPAHTAVTNVSTQFGLVRFDAHPTADAPRFEDVVFKLTGSEGQASSNV